MDTEPRYPTEVKLKRIAIADEVLAQLAAESKRLHVPAQDLVGGAIAMMLSAKGAMRSNWIYKSAQLRDQRKARDN